MKRVYGTGSVSNPEKVVANHGGMITASSQSVVRVQLPSAFIFRLFQKAKINAPALR